ncbi:hypothetical protein ACSQ6I_28295 [Anabaena sp. WFMT]|uniref:hypothetical protein n=1 Tax=Anabaena sp. WFMT TaxID=3449730 RepID=UPI003F2245A0
MISISRLPVFLAIRLQYSSDAAIDQSLVSVIGSNLPLERLMSSVMFTVLGDTFGQRSDRKINQF